MNLSRSDAPLLPILSSKLLNECLLISWMLSLRAMAKSANAHRWPHLSSHCCGRGEKKRERRRGREEEGEGESAERQNESRATRVSMCQRRGGHKCEVTEDSASSGLLTLWLQRLVLPLHSLSPSHLLYSWGHFWCDGNKLELPVDLRLLRASHGSSEEAPELNEAQQEGRVKTLFTSGCRWASNQSGSEFWKRNYVIKWRYSCFVIHQNTLRSEVQVHFDHKIFFCFISSCVCGDRTR